MIPTVDNIRDGTYPLARKLYCYTNGEPKGALKQYLDFITGDVGQAVVKDTLFVPVRE